MNTRETIETAVWLLFIGSMFYFLSACGHMPGEFVSRLAGDTSREATVAEYVRTFQRATGIEVTVPVVLATAADAEFQTSEDAVGLCYYNDEGKGDRVLLLSDFWYVASDFERWVLVLHELGHCVLGREHLDNLQRGGCPDSVMRWEISSAADCLDKSPQRALGYLQELVGYRMDPKPIEVGETNEEAK